MLLPRELDRYARQVLLFGEEGQEKLKKSHIFIAGAGGLGSPVSYYLAAAGIGTITLVDRDVVEQTNLNRQILHFDEDIGKKKVRSAEDKLSRLNPDITVRVIDATLDETNTARLVGTANGIVDAMDNFPTRYILNNVALMKNIPFFHGAVRGLYGQATTIVPGCTPCLRCLFPKAPPKELFPVVGVTPGLIAMVQSTEVIKYFVNEGRLLTNRLFLWDGLESRTEELEVARNLSCPDCSTPSQQEENKVYPEMKR